MWSNRSLIESLRQVAVLRNRTKSARNRSWLPVETDVPTAATSQSALPPEASPE